MLRRIVLAAIVVFPLLDSSARAESRWTFGLVAGSPQMLGVTAERSGESHARLQLHAGTIVVGASLGGRMVLISPERGVKPYAFIGGGMLTIEEGEGDGGTGLTPYAWVGPGLRVPTGTLTWELELGVVFGLDTGKGYPAAVPAVALGVGFGSR